MRTTLVRAIAICLIVCPPASYADSSYQKVSQVTGGQLIDSLRNVPFISKQIKALTEPTSIITMVHGNQKAVVSRESTDITDLDKQVIIHIDKEKKTYSVMTFAEFGKLMQEMPAKIAQMEQQAKDEQAKAQAQMKNQPQSQLPPNMQFKFTTTVTDPGPSKVINGVNAVQQIVTMKMDITDTDHPGTDIIYTMTTEVWSTQDLPVEMKDVQDFDIRFAKQLMAGIDLSLFKNMAASSQGAMAMMFGSKPGSAEAFAQMQKELAKIKGTRILEITRMGGSGTGMAAPQPGANGSAGMPPPPTTGSVAGQVATDTATQTAQGEAGRFGIPGAALGRSVMGAFHHKKAAAPPAPTPTPAAGSAAQAPGDVTLMEMTDQTTDFSQEAIPASVFLVPAGFKQIPSPMVQAMAK
ncbi:MAG: hypothetical protein WB439_11600 [Acidobacteriaceae bacterium]